MPVTLRGLSPEEKAEHPHAICVVVVDGEESIPVTEEVARRALAGEAVHLGPMTAPKPVEPDRDTIAETLRLVLSTRLGPPFLRAALAWREYGGEILTTTTSAGAGATEAMSSERSAVIVAERATAERLIEPPSELVDLIAERIERRRRG